MTRAAAPRLRGAVSSSRPQWARTVHRHLRVYVYLWLWFWAICIVGAAVAVVVTDRFGTVNVSVLQFVRNGPMVWFLFALGIIVSTTYLGVHVANGMTRRSFVIGGLVAGVVAALLHAVTGAALLLLEGALYDRMGWDHDAAPGEQYVRGVWETGVGPLLLDHTLTTAAGVLTGMLVGITYYRLGGWWATLALPLTMVPILYVMFATSWSEAPFVPWDLPPVSAHVFGGVGSVAAAVAFALLARTVPITRSES